METVGSRGYFAPADLEDTLREELGRGGERFGRLLLKNGNAHSYWAQNIWLEPQRLPFASIKDAAKQLRDIQRNWALYPWTLHRRAKLIQEQLPHVSAKPLEFLQKPPSAQLGAWMLIEPNVLLCSARTSSPFPNGEVQFVDEKKEPPSRAYLKLWEVFALLGKHPKPGERCLDVGASPGGWSWVLARLGANVLAADRAELAPGLMKNKLVEYRKGDAFRVSPENDGPFDWLFSDLVCYPDKLFDWLQPWLESDAAKNFVCTLKFQGKDGYAAIRRFEKIPGGRLMHLFNNKHELTWVLLR